MIKIHKEASQNWYRYSVGTETTIKVYKVVTEWEAHEQQGRRWGFSVYCGEEYIESKMYAGSEKEALRSAESAVKKHIKHEA